ncbi:3-hydroxyacyl-CoA dehydrogenase [Entomomonas asaccharolytica]|uniref:3-hydroxyacyl-CoA dehydrogenase n=2 Tax=Entomomonas asaccharolytica TaxID=2785331 RepID=A0A974NIJ8_9GAMM|nr:3-hydroxyacyl-CoA dehydrogenase [Entomomonas asaccharolytica]
MGIIGTGVMGAGIAQIAAQADIDVFLFDAREGGAQAAKDSLTKTLNKLVEKGKITEAAAKQSIDHLIVTSKIEELAPCDMVVEAIVENLDVKRGLVQQLEEILRPEAIIASNTSSLSVSAIAAGTKNPERVAGFHFFNPVPLMKVVEVIPGIKTDPAICDLLQDLAVKMGHTGVRAKDTPGFIVNHAGRAYGTEALKILGEGVATIGDIDRVLREGAGFRMGPFELLDLTALDVSHPAMESIYNQFYQEPRYRPHPLTRQMLVAGLLGRKVNEGFYRYDKGTMLNPAQPQPVPSVSNIPAVWLGVECDEDRKVLTDLVSKLGGTVETSTQPSANAICLLAPWGEDATTASIRYNVDPERTVCIDLLCNIEKHRTLMLTPITKTEIRDAAHALFAKDEVSVTVIHDSNGFIVQRILAGIVNLACDIAQQQIASVKDIDLAVRLGLGYPNGPLAWGDILGAKRILTILERINAATGDPRYRPSPWLRRRALLGIPVCHEETTINH